MYKICIHVQKNYIKKKNFIIFLQPIVFEVILLLTQKKKVN